eukprot:7120193-Pyramimonas_sp.AAC.1
MDKDREIYSMEENCDSTNNDISPSRALSVMMDEGILARDKSWSPDGSDEDASILTPQADRTETSTKREREATGRTPAPNLKKQRNEDYELNTSPLKEGFFRNATASGEWQPTIRAVVEDEEMVGQQYMYSQLFKQDEKDEEFLNAPKPPE